MLTVSIILIIVSLILIIYSVYLLKNTHKINEEVDKQNNELSNKNKLLLDKQQILENEINIKKNLIEACENQLELVQNHIKTTEQNQEELSRKAFENYCDILDQKYKEAENEHDMEIDALNTAYSNLQLKLMKEAEEYQKDLDQIKATRAAALQAQLKEKEIKEQRAFYCLTIKEAELSDIKALERIKSQLNQPRILNMLIWQTYFQKPMTTLCNNVIGTEIKTGIYKITNQKNDMCYIGQAVDLAKRWKDHAKCGLGIDTPAGNKLYKAIQEDGLWNFSFEVLELCSSKELNEKEKYYINLYQSYEFGYNSNIGIGK